MSVPKFSSAAATAATGGAVVVRWVLRAHDVFAAAACAVAAAVGEYLASSSAGGGGGLLDAGARTACVEYGPAPYQLTGDFRDLWLQNCAAKDHIEEAFAAWERGS